VRILTNAIQYNALNARFNGVDARFASLDSRFASLDSRISSGETRMSNLESRMDARFNRLKVKFDALIGQAMESTIASLGSKPSPASASAAGDQPMPDLRAINGFMVRLEAVLNSWKGVREATVEAVEDFSAHDLGYKPSADLMTFGEIARHILEASHVLTRMLLDGVDNMATPQIREIIDGYVAQLPATDGAGALARELRSQMDARIAELAAKPADFYAVEITRFDKERVTRLEMLQTIKEHELTHRAQLFMYLRLNGIVPSTTRGRIARAKA
jgi:uncharacterized damage-inducible protein DinB